MGARHRVGKGYSSKRAVPRHRKQAAASADRQERAIEKQTRQAAASQVRAESNQCDGCLAGKPVDTQGNHRMGAVGAYADLMACQRHRYP